MRAYNPTFGPTFGIFNVVQKSHEPILPVAVRTRTAQGAKKATGASAPVARHLNLEEDYRAAGALSSSIALTFINLAAIELCASFRKMSRVYHSCRASSMCVSKRANGQTHLICAFYLDANLWGEALAAEPAFTHVLCECFAPIATNNLDALALNGCLGLACTSRPSTGGLTNKCDPKQMLSCAAIARRRYARRAGRSSSAALARIGPHCVPRAASQRQSHPVSGRTRQRWLSLRR